MKRMKKYMVLTVIMAMTVIMALLAGCSSSPQTLEDYVASDEDVQAELEDLESSLGDGGSIEVVDNEIIFTYKFDTTYDSTTAEVMTSSLESAMASYDDTFEGIVDDLEEASGIDGVTMTVNYLNGDDSVLYTKTYE